MARGPGRQVLARRGGPDPNRGRLRIGVSLSQSDRRRTHARDRRDAVGRDRRHDRRHAGGESEGREADHDLQRDRRRRHPDVGRRHLHQRRTRDRRRVDESIHDAVDRALSTVAVHPAIARRRSRGSPIRHARDARAAPQARDHPEEGAADRGSGASLLQIAGFPLPRARRSLSDRAGRRAEAQGDLLHSRRGLSGRGAQARAAGAGGRRHAGGDGRAQQRPAGEAQIKSHGSARARRGAVRVRRSGVGYPPE